jgi:hypothetical protein
MSQILGDRDVLLQTSAQRSTPPTDRAILLASSANVIKVAGTTPAPASIIFSAMLLNMTGAVTFSAVPAVPLAVTGNNATLASADITTDSVTVTAAITKDGVNFTASQTVVRVTDGATGATAKALSLMASSQVFQIAKNGTNAPSSISLTAVGQNVFGSPSFTIPSGTATLTAGGSASQKFLTFANMATDSVTVQVAQDGLVDQVTIVKVREGTDALTGLLTNEAVNVATDAAGTVASYAAAAGSFKVFDGATDMTGNVAVAYSVFASSGITGAINGAGVYSVSAMTADTASVTFRAAYKGVNIDKVFTVAKSKAGAAGSPGGDGSDGSNGQRGTVNIVATGSSWSNATANAALSSAGYGAPVNRDMVTISNGSSFSETRFYDSGSWLTLSAYLNGNMVVDGTFSAGKITAGTFTGVGMNIAGGNFSVNASTGAVQAFAFNGSNSTFTNNPNPGLPAVDVTGNTLASKPSVRIISAGSNASTHGVQAQNSNYGTSGIVGMAGAYDIYADGSGTNYGPFTGAHDGLVVNDQMPDLGDLMVDVACVASRGYSNTLFTMERSSAPYQRGVRGPVAAIAGPLLDHAPAAMIDARAYSADADGNATHVHELMSGSYYAMADTHTLVAVNAVGEGSIKVCGEGGPIGPDDLLVTSSIPGVAMRQNIGADSSCPVDDVVRCYTVAKARVAAGQTIEFASTDTILVIPCIYLGG